MRIERNPTYIRIYDEDSYEDISTPQWLTIDRFKASPFPCACFVNHKASGVKECTCDGRVFYSMDIMIDDNFITHVMPIPTPDKP